jgi:hypothetical protein
MKTYPVTTVVNHDLEQLKSIAKWESDVGTNEAFRIKSESCRIGDGLHAMAEHLLDDNWDEIRRLMKDPDVHPTSKKLIPQIYDFCEVNLGKTLFTEKDIVCESLGLHGRFDALIETPDGDVAIVDWKNAKKHKREEYCQNYIRQATCYAMMIEEELDIVVDKYAIVIATPTDGLQILSDRIGESHYEAAIKRIEEYMEFRLEEVGCY